MNSASPDKSSSFLSAFEVRPAQLPLASGLSPIGLVIGQGSRGLEIAIYSSSSRPPRETIRKVWKERSAGRAVPLLAVVLHEQLASICGHTEFSGEVPPVQNDLELAHVEKLCETALSLPDHHSVDRFLREQLPETESPIFGIRNQGLLATYVITRGKHEVNSEQWHEATQKAAKTRGKSDRALLNLLGFTVESLAGPASILSAKGSRVALAVFLDQTESAEISSKRFNSQTPIAYALNLAQNHNLDWVIVARGAELRLYPTSPGVGVGRRGLTDTYLQINPGLVTEDHLALLWMAFSAEGLATDGHLKDLLEKSSRYAADIGKRLRVRIYEFVIPQLAKAIVEARNLKKPSAADLELTYQMSMLVLFRLLFIAYAEDHDLLPYRTNESYKTRSLTQKARELKRIRETGAGFDRGSSHWTEFMLLCDAVRIGNDEWGVPPYDGGLFDEDETRRAGKEIRKVQLSNQDFGHVLSQLLLDEGTPEGLGPVDFRALGVREFGTIYEGLLENELSVADNHLAVDKKGFYKPVDDAKTAVVRKNEVYLHNRSGARKATGSYYTKSFAVDHLLNHSLEPALESHLAKVAQIARAKPEDASRQLFEFYVADISMGSGHFLISAIDRIEKRLITFLHDNALPGVDEELERLRTIAFEKLRKLRHEVDERLLEKNKLLRRLIARRCIYGVDINPLAVELARLSVWIHTFVPGLPLSFLDHNLVPGNSLVGIATLEELTSELQHKAPTPKRSASKTRSKAQLKSEYGPDVFERLLHQRLDSVAEPLKELRLFIDADEKEISAVKQLFEQAQDAASVVDAVMSLVTVRRLDRSKFLKVLDIDIADYLMSFDDWSQLLVTKALSYTKEELEAVIPFHFPIAFPEVFLRETPGFDVILGNPPWQEATVEEYAFWARHFPGLRGLKQSDQEVLKEKYRRERPDLQRQLEVEIAEAELLRDVLVSGPYPGMGTGDPDLYKAFCWRFWNLIRKDGGYLGVVLPRSAWFVKGSKLFRIAVFTEGIVNDLTNLLNSAGWVFDDAEHRYTISLSSVRSGDKEVQSAKREVSLRGPYRNLNRFILGTQKPPLRFAVNDVLSWTDTASLPLLPSEESAEVFVQLRKSPRLDTDAKGWRCRPHAELHATNDKKQMTLTSDCPRGYWPVYKGESFDIWTPDTGKYYAWVDPEKICAHLQQKREHSHKLKKSVFSEFPAKWITDPKTLPCLHPRIAFRDVTNRTNQRTVIAALVPPEVVITNQAPFLLWPAGDETDQAFLLGFLSSICLDWYSRRFVETHVNFHVLNPFPIPRAEKSNKLRQRVVALAGRLACPDKRFVEWAKAVGVKCGPLKDNEKNDMIAELDAVVAHLYGLSEKQLIHIFGTFHEGWDYEERLRATLKWFGEWGRSL